MLGAYRVCLNLLWCCSPVVTAGAKPQEEIGIAPLGHRQGLLMAIADLATYNSQTHGGSPSQHSAARTQGRPQTAPSARGHSPARRSDGSASPDRGLKVVPPFIPPERPNSLLTAAVNILCCVFRPAMYMIMCKAIR